MTWRHIGAVDNDAHHFAGSTSSPAGRRKTTAYNRGSR